MMRSGARGFLALVLAGAHHVALATAKNARLEDKGPPPPFPVFEPLTSPPKCLPCENLFSRLEVDTSQPLGRGMVQRVEMVERGEPKSGTGGMFEWATGSLYHICQYLNQRYGRESCFVDWGRWSPGDFYGNHTLVFEPPLQQPSDAPCSCEGVQRVTITLCKIGKHELPVGQNCPFYHGVGYHLHTNFCEGSGESSSPMDNYWSVWRCMREARCPIVDDRLQMAVFRDPRPAAVSSFYHLKASNYIPASMDIDTWVAQNFQSFCKWVIVRLILFTRMLPKGKAAFFWYDEWQANALDWHQQLFHVIGLQVPSSVLLAATKAALSDNFPFFTKGRDTHADASIRPLDRTYRDEISNDTASSIDETLRKWLPPKFAARLKAW